MKPLNTIRFITAVTAIISASAASLVAQTVVVDEFGNGTFNGNPISSQVAGGGLGLQYTLPYVVFPGNVVIHENIAGNPVSDVIIFTNTFMFFQSDSTDGADSPADVASFLFTGGPTVDIFEQGPEGNNFAIYTPNPNTPGYNLSTSSSPNYDFISDVPEPAGSLLTILGGGLLLGLRSRQARRN